jgi:protein-disulfide isomerase
MKSLLMAGAAGLVLTLAACGGGGGTNNTGVAAPRAPVADVAAPNGGDRTQTHRETERGFMMGNPDAPVKLVEYASITCPHCGEFSRDGGSEGLRNYVRSGRVSWEYRPFMLGFPTDPGLFALLRCNGADAFFQAVDQLYLEQQTWAVRGQTWLEANRAAFERMDVQGRAAALARETGVDAFFRQRGMTQQQIDQCLADPRNLQRVAEDTQRGAQQDNVSGTPTFIINGAQQPNVGLWRDLEPLLRRAVGG